ncbi:uncharacterized protein LOC132937519 [Metopolophium dirhodum]|uniref:uncharacterized protein LOC132937519 n=1 Tax=Metopolophium dirhodum TaxID=44670 RepID=UPI002990086C|nr:uncharacterized protein LOC132937519 [Metopolophium dirhodum]
MMKIVKKKEKRKVRSVKLQIERLDKAFYSLCHEKNNINLNFENSPIGQEVKLLRKTIEDQYSIIGTFSVTDIVNKMIAILEQNSKSEIFDGKLNERNMLILESKELDKTLKTMKREQEKLKNRSSQLIKEQRVYAHLASSIYQKKNDENIIEQ